MILTALCRPLPSYSKLCRPSFAVARDKIRLSIYADVSKSLHVMVYDSILASFESPRDNRKKVFCLHWSWLTFTSVQTGQHPMRWYVVHVCVYESFTVLPIC